MVYNRIIFKMGELKMNFDFQFLANFNKVVRWLLVLPSAIVGYLLVALLIMFLDLVSFGGWSFSPILFGLIIDIAFVLSIVYFPVSVAPSKKIVVGIIFTTLYILLTVYSFFNDLILFLQYSDNTLLLNLVSNLITMIIAVMFMRIIYKKLKTR